MQSAGPTSSTPQVALAVGNNAGAVHEPPDVAKRKDDSGNERILTIGENVGAQHVVPVHPLGKDDTNLRSVGR